MNSVALLTFPAGLVRLSAVCSCGSYPSWPPARTSWAFVHGIARSSGL